MLASGACRTNFDDVTTDATGRSDDAGDASADATPCTFGDVSAEYLFPDQMAGIYDADRIEAARGRVYVAVAVQSGVELQELDVGLVPSGARVPLAGAPGNLGLRHRATDDTFVVYGTAATDAPLVTYAIDGTVLRGPTATGFNTGSGFVDDIGHLHVSLRVANGMREYAADHSLVRTWAGDAPSGCIDAVLDPARQRAWIGTQSGVALYDMSTTTPTLQYVVPLPDIGPFSTVVEAMAIDDAGVLYVINRNTSTLYVMKDGAIVDTRSYAPEDLVAIDFEPVTQRLIMGFLVNLETTRLRAVCPYR